MIQAFESTKFNFTSMKTWLDKSLAKNKEFDAILPTFQDQLTIIQANLDHLQVKWVKLEVEY
jgi:hypothetical protein